ncbi:MAG TPA: methyltransferase [Eudoraea sp.]|nr:methyltransferase [Eudoraea sp.]
MRKFLKKITDPVLKKGLQLYYTKPRKYTYEGLEVLVHPDVFPPHLTFSTKILLDFITPLEMEGKSVLELGCGCGILSLWAAKKGAFVTATDINRKALEFLEAAAKKNGLDVEVCYSDLFESLAGRHFEFILINPPYYPKNAVNVKEKGWYCGEDFGYFENLFQQLPIFGDRNNHTYMILSEDCDIGRIGKIAAKNGRSLSLCLTKTKMGEINFIYRID